MSNCLMAFHVYILAFIENTIRRSSHIPIQIKRKTRLNSDFDIFLAKEFALNIDKMSLYVITSFTVAIITQPMTVTWL